MLFKLWSSLEYIYTGLRNSCLYGAQIGPTKYLATLPDCFYASFCVVNYVCKHPYHVEYDHVRLLKTQ